MLSQHPLLFNKCQFYIVIHPNAFAIELNSIIAANMGRDI